MTSPFDSKNRIATALDRLALRVLLFMLCVFYFFYLWHSGVSSLIAGSALFLLVLLFILLLERRTLTMRDHALRVRIGGAIALEELLVLDDFVFEGGELRSRRRRASARCSANRSAQSRSAAPSCSTTAKPIWYAVRNVSPAQTRAKEMCFPLIEPRFLPTPSCVFLPAQAVFRPPPCARANGSNRLSD